MGDVRKEKGRPGLLKITDVMEELAASRTFVYAAMDAGKLPYVQLGAMRRIRREDLDAYIRANLITG